MIIDLDSLRPKNESYKHFFLKQVARAWLFEEGIKYVACEVHISGSDISPFGVKYISDVVGVNVKRTSDSKAYALYQKWDQTALKYASEIEGLTTPSYNGKPRWADFYGIHNDKSVARNYSRENCYKQAAKEMGLPEWLRHESLWLNRYDYNVRSIESKVSLSDFHNGFSMNAEHSYIIAPKGVIPLQELPEKVGLLEFNFDTYEADNSDGIWQNHLVLTKAPKKIYDSSFYNDRVKKKGLMKEKHGEYAMNLIYRIAQQSTQEQVAWNPFLKKKPFNSIPESYYRYKIGDETPLGYVTERRFSNVRKSDVSTSARRYQFMQQPYYRLLKPNIGLTGWIAEPEIITAQYSK